jgi:hypothetical protein
MIVSMAVLSAGLLAGVVSLPAHAHHSFSMFDHARTVTLKGTVESFSWANPHVHITMVVAPASNRQAGKWEVEGASTNIMFRQGWNRLSLKPGDAITVVGFPLKDGTDGVSLIYAVTPGGKQLWQDVSRPKITPES